MSNQKDILVILGPTASGKTKLACEVALKIKGEIISADSRQFYRGMDIGTGKDIDEYEVEGKTIPYHLIDNKEAGYRYNIAEYEEDFIKAYKDIRKRQAFPILCGGSGLYIEAAVRGNTFHGVRADKEFQAQLEGLPEEEIESRYMQIDKQLREKLPAPTLRRKIRALDIERFLKQNSNWQFNDREPLKALIIGIDVNRNVRRERITKRLKKRLESGLVEEVENLLKKGLSYDDLEYYGLEYKWVGNYLKGGVSRDKMFERLNIAIHQFAKRQMTWFRKMERNGFDINWIPEELDDAEKMSRVVELLEN